MTGEELLKNMELIDPELVEAAEVPPGRKRNRWLPWVAAAAAAIAAVSLLWKHDFGTTVTIGGIERKYKSTTVSQAETVPFFPWEYLTEMERYTHMVLDGMQFRTRARTIRPEFLGNAIGEGFFPVEDWETGTDYSRKRTAYSIQDMDSSQVVAVKLGDEYCVFMNEIYSPPPDFGTFWDAVDLSGTVKLDYFTHFSGENTDNQQTSHRLEDDTALWALLEKCRSAPYLELDRFLDSETETVSFSVTSEKLGVYKHGFQITSDGYVITNLMEWGYVFQIGEAAAKEMISWVKKNSVTVPQEPYYQFLYGTYAGTEDGYLLVDDTILCVDEKDGMIFRIPTEDIKISRMVDLGYLTVGDVVLVNFTGTVDVGSGNIVSSPVSVQTGILWEGEILIEE